MVKGEAAFQGLRSHVPFSQRKAFDKGRRTSCSQLTPRGRPGALQETPSWEVPALLVWAALSLHCPTLLWSHVFPRGQGTVRAWVSGDLASGAQLAPQRLCGLRGIAFPL